MNKDEEYMKEALEEAERAYREDEVPIGCVIVKNDRIVARSHNQKQIDRNPIHHAEILAMQSAMKETASRYLTDCDLYVTLEPCMMCTGAIVNCRVKRVVFATRDPKGGSFVSSIRLHDVPKINHYPLMEEGVCQQEAAELLRSFFRKKRKK